MRQCQIQKIQNVPYVEKLLEKNTTGKCLECFNKEKQEKVLDRWLKTGDTGCKTATTIRGAIRQYIYKKQDYKCQICGIPNTWNGKELKFILDHIDGNADNNIESNLRLICPNCDSQLDTYKSKNKNSARKHR